MSQKDDDNSKYETVCTASISNIIEQEKQSLNKKEKHADQGASTRK